MANKNSRIRREARVVTTKARVEYRAGLTTAQQLQRLDERLGAGKGAVRERSRLAALLEAPPASTNKPKHKR